MTRGKVRRVGLAAVLLAMSTLGPACSDSLDEQLRDAIASQEITGLRYVDAGSPELIVLGEALFFDKLLSGNRDVACSTCHYPGSGTTDGLALSIGTGGTGLGAERVLGVDRDYTPRNAPGLYDVGARGVKNAFWDGRVVGTERVATLTDVELPGGLDGALAGQAMLHVLERTAMRGRASDGDKNELGAYGSTEHEGIWDGIMSRLADRNGYQVLFGDAYPSMTFEALEFEEAANALAAFQVANFRGDGSAWDAYVAGDDAALSEDAKRGAVLFFGEAGCSDCHSGTLLSDQEFHNLCVPQIGPGRGPVAPLDLGRGGLPGYGSAQFAFRTPRLRNVAETAPYMHNGSIATLEEAVRWHFDACEELRNWDAEVLPPQYQMVAVDKGTYISSITGTVDSKVDGKKDFGPDELLDLVAFLEALTDPDASSLTPPEHVPSGLPVDGVE